MSKANIKVDTIKKLDKKDLKDVNIKETKDKIVESVKETVYGKDRVRIMLIMMIKNESKIIERALQSVAEFVDGIVVCDTGSTDDTVSIVNKYFKTLKIPTKLYKHKWQNFGHNRSLSFTETVSFCKSLKWPLDKTYGLLLDADQELNVDDDLFDRQDLTESGYNLLLKTSYNIYHVPKLINLGKKWRCVGSTHEYWEDPEDEKGPKDIDEDKMYIDDIGDGGCKSDKYERDIRLLTEELKNPINESRTIYYLGQSYFDSDQHEEAIKWFEKRIQYTLNNKIVDDKNDNTEEVYQAYLKIALSKKELDKPDLVNAFMKCIELYPKMLEPIYYLMKYYMDLEKWKEAYEIGKLGLDIEMDDKFITEYQIYEHLYKDDMLMVCLENQKYGIGIKLGLSLLKERKFDREDKERIKDNYKLCLEYLYMNDINSDSDLDSDSNSESDSDLDIELKNEELEQPNKEIFVSVTSIFSNQDILLETLKSISAQTLLPTKCFIYLSSDPSIFDNGFVDNIITNIDLKDYILNNKIFELNWVKDIGPYTKLLPILKDKWNDDCLIITIDDDTVYDTNLIKNLVNDFNKYKCMINYRGFTFKFDKLNDITYENRTYRKLDLYNFATGKGGILYHPSFFHATEDLIFNEELYNKYCDKTDDIWFNFIRICNKIKCYIGNKTWLAKDISSNGLYVKYNSIDNRNTKNIQELVQFLIKSNYIK